MSTMTQPRKGVKPFTCSFVSINVEIMGTRYAVDPIDPGEFGTKAWRLTKHSGNHEVYDVIHDAFGCVACSCPDYIARHDGTSSMCKHGRALTSLGLMPMPAPIPAPAVAHVPDEFDPPAPCCEPTEPEPCKACVAIDVPADDTPTAIEPDPAPELPADLVDPDDAGSDPELWPDGWDDHVWNLGPAPDDDDAPAASAEAEPRLTLAEMIDRQADAYRALGNGACELIARALDELALRVRLCDARTPDEFDARSGLLEADRHEASYRAGFEDGRAAACEPAGAAFGHMA